ncbi:hypothetical protein BUALT_Bualt12G0055200 [Buddleja alternifolia]|uniref:Uncharacterized protein n=1 Tax=Buddleja alternifolia TaxID=168488 RepID=A0AAV6WQ68_9LAMI|nr:hypothetical protein BUALT_Bualt12G0055200 [Buddleja alternifolia]
MYCVRSDQIPITFVRNNRPNLSILSMIKGERVEDYSALLFHMAGRIMAHRLYFKEYTYEVVVDLSRGVYYKEVLSLHPRYSNKLFIYQIFSDSWSQMYCVRSDQIPITFVGNNRPNLSILSMIKGERVEDYSALLFHMAGRIMAHRLYFKEYTYEVVVDLSREEYCKEAETGAGLPQANVMERIEDMQEEIREMRQRMGVSAPDPPKGVHFCPRILADELSNNFRAPNVSKYDGLSDPTEHLSKFENCALLHQYSDGVKC